MKIAITFEVSDFDRESIANFYGEEGKASHKTMKQFIEAVVSAEIENKNWTLQSKEEEVQHALDELATQMEERE